MKKKGNVRARLRKQASKDAAAIVKKVHHMVKKGVPRTKIEKKVVADLSVHFAKQMRLVAPEVIVEND
jgi:hypothetical protein